MVVKGRNNLNSVLNIVLIAFISGFAGDKAKITLKWKIKKKDQRDCA